MGLLASVLVATELVQLTRGCRDAADLQERLRFAEELVVRVGPMLGAFLAAHCPEAAVEDVLQETLIGIGKGAAQCRGTSDRQVWQWCYRVAFNQMATHWRRQGARPTVSLELDEVRQAVEAAWEDSPAKPGDRLDLDGAMQLLARSKPPCVDYLTFHFLEGMGYPELAALYNTTANAIRMQIQRCLTLARELVRKHA